MRQVIHPLFPRRDMPAGKGWRGWRAQAQLACPRQEKTLCPRLGFPLFLSLPS